MSAWAIRINPFGWVSFIVRKVTLVAPGGGAPALLGAIAGASVDANAVDERLYSRLAVEECQAAFWGEVFVSQGGICSIDRTAHARELWWP